ncbi:MLP-like protein 34 [Amaranthus tricolor]|uniref:MLP-like protein 34 n=1 Tax=Amaranthus tricolor TaxID=29722 RepID=UPI002587A5D0|nr:MLP-like protein 34 [Amaranthus tricolor]
MASTGLKRKLEGEIELRVGAAEAFHELYQEKPHEISNIHPEFVQACDLHDGAYGTPGSIIYWKYTLDGKPQVAKEIIEMVDEKNKKIRFKVIEGHLLDDYNSFVFVSQVISEGDELCLVKWTLEYEKKHSGIPEPSTLMDALLDAAKRIDEHHHRQDKN